MLSQCDDIALHFTEILINPDMSKGLGEKYKGLKVKLNKAIPFDEFIIR